MKYQVKLIPTNEPTSILLGKRNRGWITEGVLYYHLDTDGEIIHVLPPLSGQISTGKEAIGDVLEYQHLYIVSDEEPKEGELCLFNGNLIKFKKPSNPYFYKKVVLSTDRALGSPIPNEDSLRTYLRNPTEYVKLKEGSSFNGLFNPVQTTTIICNDDWTVSFEPIEPTLAEEKGRMEYQEANQKAYEDPYACNPEYHQECGLSRYEWEIDNLVDRIKAEPSSLLCIKMVEEFIDKKLMEL